MFSNRAVAIANAVTLALALVIAVLTLTPLPAGGPAGSDKFYHVIAFASLAFPLSFVRRRLVVWVTLSAVAYGGVIEIVQPYFGRQAEWADFGADGFGAVLGGAIGYAVSGLLLWRS